MKGFVSWRSLCVCKVEQTSLSFSISVEKIPLPGCSPPQESYPISLRHDLSHRSPWALLQCPWTYGKCCVFLHGMLLEKSDPHLWWSRNRNHRPGPGTRSPWLGSWSACCCTSRRQPSRTSCSDAVSTPVSSCPTSALYSRRRAAHTSDRNHFPTTGEPLLC